MNFHFGEQATARQLVMEHHYSHRWPSNVQVVGTWHLDGGLFGDSGEAVAACVFAIPPTRWSQPVLELIRLVRHPDHAVTLSGLVSATARWAHRKGWPLLVSFADSTVGHHGGIYQACSWNYDGQRAPRMDGVVVNGQFISGRTVNHLYGTQSPDKLRAMGYDVEPHYDAGKHLYWRAGNRAGSAMARQLNLKQLPYPKPDVMEAVA